ncbi:MAG: ribosomal subunit protein large subunit ribosomal protein [Candidatus Parcubacteria bacterium]|jgi:large subunit ribosomal protein L23
MATKKTTQAADTEGKKVPLIQKVRITEKAGILNGAINAYTFNVEGNANKTELKKQIELTYKVKPLAINVMNTPKKKVFIRGKWGVKGGGKKVVVFLKKGDSINLA